MKNRRHTGIQHTIIIGYRTTPSEVQFKPLYDLSYLLNRSKFTLNYRFNGVLLAKQIYTITP